MTPFLKTAWPLQGVVRLMPSSEHALQFTGYVEGAMRAGQHAVDKLLFPNDAREVLTSLSLKVRDDLAWKIKKGIVDLVRGPEENGMLGIHTQVS